jgi:hypothetical protein
LIVARGHGIGGQVLLVRKAYACAGERAPRAVPLQAKIRAVIRRSADRVCTARNVELGSRTSGKGNDGEIKIAASRTSDGRIIETERVRLAFGERRAAIGRK